jgi:hypothetical protein
MIACRSAACCRFGGAVAHRNFYAAAHSNLRDATRSRSDTNSSRISVRRQIVKNHIGLFFIALPAALLAVPTQARGLEEICRARSSYDLTVTDAALLFERRRPGAQRLEIGSGRLTVNSFAVPLDVRDRQRITEFETAVRALIPRIKALAQRGVDLSAAAVREEAADVSPRSAADPKLEARLEARARNLKTRIANSTTTKEWQGAAFNRYTTEIVADVVPLVAGDLAQRALELAVRGDLAGAAKLTDRAAGMRTSLEARIRNKLTVLEPEVAKLCPSFEWLDALESALTARLPDGSRLDVIEIRG